MSIIISTSTGIVEISPEIKECVRLTYKHLTNSAQWPMLIPLKEWQEWRQATQCAYSILFPDDAIPDVVIPNP